MPHILPFTAHKRKAQFSQRSKVSQTGLHHRRTSDPFNCNLIQSAFMSLFNPFRLNPPCQFIPLLSFRSLVFSLTPSGRSVCVKVFPSQGNIIFDLRLPDLGALFRNATRAQNKSWVYQKLEVPQGEDFLYRRLHIARLYQIQTRYIQPPRIRKIYERSLCSTSEQAKQSNYDTRRTENVQIKYRGAVPLTAPTPVLGPVLIYYLQHVQG